jgi:chemotaxis protein MotB
MMMQSMNVARRIGRARMVVVAVIGLLGLTLGGCSSSNTALLEANRALQEQNTKLVQDKEALTTLNQQLQDSLAARDKAIAELQSLLNDMKAGRADLASRIDELTRKSSGLSFGNIALDAQTDQALKELAAQHSDLLEYDAARGMIRFKSDVTFDSGKDTLSANAKSTIRQFAQILNTTAAAYDVRILGHTDSQPIRRTAAQHPTNWHLSCHRAISVLRELTNNGFASERGEAAGRGEFDPMVPNTASGNTPQNRRVEVFMTKPFRSMGTGRTTTTTSTTAPATTPSATTKPAAKTDDDFQK